MTHQRTKRPFTPDELDRLAKLEAMRDEDIDFSDIPELTDEQWREAFRPARVMLDAKLVDWFKNHPTDVPYQIEINRALRRHVAKAEGKRA